MRRLLFPVILLLALLAALCGASTVAAFTSTGDGGWVWQNPLPQGNNLQSIDFVDTENGWAVGGQWGLPSWLAPSWGAIMRTRDGGATWGSECCFDGALRAVSFLDTRRGWAVGDVVMMTTDGGTSWVQSPSPVRSLQAVDFVDADNGWAVGGGDGTYSGYFRTIVHSGDGGASWQQQYYYRDSGHDGASLHAVDFVSTTIGWAVGEAGLILHTTDGGASWQQQYSLGRDDAALCAVEFVSPTTGWAVGEGLILHTVDGGETWTEQDAGTDANLSAVAFTDATTGCAVGNGFMIRTTDAGSSWVPVSSGSPGGSDIDFVTPSEGWTGGTSLHTSDGGASWVKQSSSVTGNDLNSIDFADAATGWAVGDAGTILHTVDGGALWSSQVSGTADDLQSVDFVDAESGWAAGGSFARGVVLHTANGGATWETQLADSGGPLVAVQFVDKLAGWAVGGSDRRSSILHTTDGGLTWSAQEFEAQWQSWLLAVDFVSRTTGWVLAHDNSYYGVDTYYLLKTSDGGASWCTQSIPMRDSVDLHAIDFVDESTGYVVGGYYGSGDHWSEVHKTTDGGATWSSSYNFRSWPLRAVQFTDPNTGWVAGTFGEVRHTTDGGDTWQLQRTGSHTTLADVRFVDELHGWVLGPEGAILHTVTGGLPDTKPPVTRQEGADDLWHNGERTMTFSAIDQDAPWSSGVDFTEYALDGGPWSEGTSLTIAAPADHSNDGVHTVFFRSRDYSGNLEASQSCEVKIDTTAPVITLSTPWEGATFVRGQVVTADWSVSDALSGVDSAVGTVASGALIDTASCGRKSFNVSANDLAGNSASLMVRYRVPFVSAGVLPPLSPTKTSVVRGACTPVAFRIFTVRGWPVRRLAPVLHLAKLSDGLWGSEFDPTSSSAPKDATVFRYERWAMRYVYNLNTKVLAAGTYRLRIDLGNGGEMIASFSLR